MFFFTMHSFTIFPFLRNRFLFSWTNNNYLPENQWLMILRSNVDIYYLSEINLSFKNIFFISIDKVGVRRQKPKNHKNVNLCNVMLVEWTFWISRFYYPV